MSLTEKKFGTLSDGTDISSYTLKNTNGASVTLLSFGARVQSIQMPKESSVNTVILMK